MYWFFLLNIYIYMYLIHAMLRMDGWDGMECMHNILADELFVCEILLLAVSPATEKSIMGPVSLLAVLIRLSTFRISMRRGIVPCQRVLCRLTSWWRRRRTRRRRGPDG